jgi:WD40 repeat protein
MEIIRNRVLHPLAGKFFYSSPIRIPRPIDSCQLNRVLIHPHSGEDGLETTGKVTIAISPDDVLVLAGMEDGTVCIWNISTGQLLERFRGHARDVSSVGFTPDGRGFVTSSRTKRVKLWKIDFDIVHKMADKRRSVKDTREGKSCVECIHTLKGHKGAVRQISVSPNGQWIASTSRDKSMVFWDRNGTPRLVMKQDYGDCRFDSLCLWQGSANANNLHSRMLRF